MRLSDWRRPEEVTLKHSYGQGEGVIMKKNIGESSPDMGAIGAKTLWLEHAWHSFSEEYQHRWNELVRKIT